MNTKKGRPSKFEQVREIILNLAMFGLTDAQMAAAVDVTEVTFNNWKKTDPEFFKSLKHQKEIADSRVEQSLYHKATGYSHKDTQFATFEGKITDQLEYMKHYPPSDTAMIFWLKNRQPEKWRDKLDVNNQVSGSLSVNIERRVINSKSEVRKNKPTQNTSSDIDLDEII